MCVQVVCLFGWILLLNICGFDIRSVIMQPFEYFPLCIRTIIVTEMKLFKIIFMAL